ncbi:lysoplasmalogenase isoform X2 [Echinops telfairi]|uniref:Lysoplasmalogenase isoform X2 n=1 Tax=Echinops telfairi TaxID=9371 RepID=A0AC55DAH0_ECHTE|nr:lysoplasmalogenase isoform X2 [Echinops telfairi]
MTSPRALLSAQSPQDNPELKYNQIFSPSPLPSPKTPVPGQRDLVTCHHGHPGKESWPSSLVKCLTPFLLTCPAYFLFWIPEDPPSLLGALVKCLPVLSLAAGLQALTPPGSTATLLKWGLLCSAVGDACLIWPDAFLHGMVAFAAAHLFYLVAFGFSPLRPGLLLPIALVSGLYLCFLLLHLPPDMTLPVAAYSLMLAAVLWRGLARGGSAGLGALLFTLSDAVLAWGTFVWPLPHARLMIMTTYYAAQALIALSVLEGPKHKAS